MSADLLADGDGATGDTGKGNGEEGLAADCSKAGQQAAQDGSSTSDGSDEHLGALGGGGAALVCALLAEEVVVQRAHLRVARIVLAVLDPQDRVVGNAAGFGDPLKVAAAAFQLGDDAL